MSTNVYPVTEQGSFQIIFHNLLSSKNLRKIISPKMTIKLCSEISRISMWMPLKETLVQ